ncbi:MAG: hypothetical protein ACRD3V_33325, partial [Vicinamibacteria bacterium]
MRLGRREFLATAAAAAGAASHKLAGASPALDPLGARVDFPAASRSTYLNTPYIGPIPRPVEGAGIDFVRSKAESPIPLGTMLEKGNEARKKFATLFGAEPHEVGFLFATSEGENLVTSA